MVVWTTNERPGTHQQSATVWFLHLQVLNCDLQILWQKRTIYWYASPSTISYSAIFPVRRLCFFIANFELVSYLLLLHTYVISWGMFVFTTSPPPTYTMYLLLNCILIQVVDRQPKVAICIPLHGFHLVVFLHTVLQIMVKMCKQMYVRIQVEYFQ